MIWMANRTALLARSSRAWPSVEGTVASSGISSTWVRTGRITLMHYAPALQYNFVVDGKPYTGTRIGFSDEWLGAPGNDAKSRAEANAARWSSGSTVQVFYDPADPSESALVAGGEIPFTTWSGNFVGVLMAIGAIVCAYFALARR